MFGSKPDDTGDGGRQTSDNRDELAQRCRKRVGVRNDGINELEQNVSVFSATGTNFSMAGMSLSAMSMLNWSRRC